MLGLTEPRQVEPNQAPPILPFLTAARPTAQRPAVPSRACRAYALPCPAKTSLAVPAMPHFAGACHTPQGQTRPGQGPPGLPCQAEPYRVAPSLASPDRYGPCRALPCRDCLASPRPAMPYQTMPNQARFCPTAPDHTCHALPGLATPCPPAPDRDVQHQLLRHVLKHIVDRCYHLSELVEIKQFQPQKIHAAQQALAVEITKISSGSNLLCG